MTTFTRHKMRLDLQSFETQARLPAHYNVEPLHPDDIVPLAELELEGYRDTVDWDLVPELQTLEGCRRFIGDLLRGQPIFEGKQGAFRADLSYKLVAGTKPAGAIYTLFTEDEAFIIDFVVAPEHRGKGLGTHFLSYALQRYREAGFKWALLYVTATNYSALRLYEKLGFRVEDTYTTGPQAVSE